MKHKYIILIADMNEAIFMAVGGHSIGDFGDSTASSLVTRGTQEECIERITEMGYVLLDRLSKLYVNRRNQMDEVILGAVNYVIGADGPAAIDAYALLRDLSFLHACVGDMIDSVRAAMDERNTSDRCRCEHPNMSLSIGSVTARCLKCGFERDFPCVCSHEDNPTIDSDSKCYNCGGTP